MFYRALQVVSRFKYPSLRLKTAGNHAIGSRSEACLRRVSLRKSISGLMTVERVFVNRVLMERHLCETGRLALPISKIESRPLLNSAIGTTFSLEINAHDSATDRWARTIERKHNSYIKLLRSLLTSATQ